MNRSIRTVLFLQAMLTALAASIGLFWIGAIAAFSLLIGGSIALVGALIYAFTAYRIRFAPPRVLLNRHFQAEAKKLVITVCLFAVVFFFVPQLTGSLVLLGYALALCAYPVSLLLK